MTGSSLYLFTLLTFSISPAIFADQNKQDTQVKTKLETAPVASLSPLDTAPVPVELKRLRGDSFKNTDLNKDGKISLQELLDYQEIRKKARATKEADRLIKGCDKNKDGMISLNELPSEDEMQLQINDVEFSEVADFEKVMSSRCMFPKEILEMMDLNEDGVVTRDEILLGVSSSRAPNKKIEKKMEKKMLSRETKRRKKEFSKCDVNADEILTLREAFSMRCNLNLFTEQFDAYDSNKDGILTADEIAKVVKPVKFTPPEDPKYIERRKKMPPLSRLQSSMYECDKDEDGRLSKSETVGARCEQDLVYFDTVDHDSDGYVTFEEIERMRTKQRFDRQDTNKDGFLDAKEFKAFNGHVFNLPLPLPY